MRSTRGGSSGSTASSRSPWSGWSGASSPVALAGAGGDADREAGIAGSGITGVTAAGVAAAGVTERGAAGGVMDLRGDWRGTPGGVKSVDVRRRAPPSVRGDTEGGVGVGWRGAKKGGSTALRR
ncbi:MAG TPA: hypothetical protein VF041_21045 [Gemmatimonadaceae bacterium]